MICSVDGCEKPAKGRGLCKAHWHRWNRGQLKIDAQLRRRRDGTGTINHAGYLALRHGGHHRLEHREMAERALGKPLPRTAEVHHFDGDRLRNVGGNLVICPGAEYHQLLETRTRALNACGNANWRKCTFCQTHDDPTNLFIRLKPAIAYHRSCSAAYARDARQRKSQGVN